MSNLPKRPSARVFCNSAKLQPGETLAKRRRQKTPWRKCHHLLIKISLRCQPSTTFCCKPRLPKCPWSRAMSNLPRRPSARVFRNSAKLRPGETPATGNPQKKPWPKCHHLLISSTWSANIAQHFAATRDSQRARKAELWQTYPGEPQRAFSEILQSCEQGKLLQKAGHKKHPGSNAIIS